MTQQRPTGVDDVNRAYDVFAEAGTTTALGGNIHVGYWTEDDEYPMVEATDRLTDLVAAHLDVRAGHRLLDVGCGNGVPALRVADTLDVHVTGATINGQQEAQAREAAADRQAADRTSFLVADAMELPFDDDFFDAAWAIESLLHMPDQVAALTEIRRVVRPGCRLVVADLCQRRPFEGADRALLDGMLDVYEIAAINTLDEHRSRLEQAGWRIRDLTDLGEQVRPSYRHAAAAFRELAAPLGSEAADHLTTAADLMEAFGAHPDAGYALVVAEAF